jgi:acyl-CoA dehydrogenase
MSLILNEEQQLLKDSAREFLAAKAPVSALRRLRDSKDDVGFSRALWKEMAELGWAGVLIDESYGGSGFGFVGAGAIAEEMGRTLTASPFLSSAVLAATALQKSGSAAMKAAHLPAIAAGERVIALGVDEGPKHDPAGVALRAEKSGNGFRLSGAKSFVADGHVADKVIIAARTAGAPGENLGITLFLVDPRAKGASVERTAMVDSRNAARLALDGVEATGEDVIGVVDEGFSALETVLCAGRAGLSAELSGAAQASFDMTVGYLKQRTQFGRPIGAFQAIQHRLAQLYCEIELMKSAVMKALSDLDESASTSSGSVSLAKAKAGAVAKRASQEGVQLHGGIGMTDEHDIGLFMKRIRVAQEMFGDAAFHADRLAHLRGY